MSAVIRDYVPSDFEAIKRIHDATEINYKLPNINSPLFLVKKVLEIEGKVVMAAGMYVQCECYLWSDPSDWSDPQDKLVAIKALDREVMRDTWLKGVECAVLWLPPGMERFGERLVEDLHFVKDRSGWLTYSKDTKNENYN